jgi:carotenoid cleavage dioxygenase-like enzyme
MTLDANWPQHPNLQGAFAPYLAEDEITPLEVVGEIPRELHGTLYRNGPNPQFPPRGGMAYHWFDGDGMIHAVSLADGRAQYKNRWVRTRRFDLERKAGRALFGGLTSMAESDPAAMRALEARGLSPYEQIQLAADAGNTNVIWHAQKLLALLEIANPTELDPRTLATRGACDFDGKLAGGMTAHPKVDPETGELLGFVYSAVAPYLRYHVVDRAGRLTRTEPIDVPVGAMMHDFIATREHVIFPWFPMSFREENLRTNAVWHWEPELGTRIGVIPRDGGNRDVVWFELDTCFVYHFLNAHSDGRRVIVEGVRYPHVGLFPVAKPGEPEPPPAPGLMTRFTLDLATRTCRVEPLDDVQCEFPRLDERRAGLSYRHGFAPGTLPRDEGAVPFNAILHYDLAKGTRRVHELAPASTASEAVFVPRGSSAAEGEGFLLFPVYRWAEDRSDVLILDAQNVERAPLATIRLPHRLPLGFHGNYAPGVTLS